LNKDLSSVSPVKFLDLATQYRSIQGDIDHAVLRVLSSSVFVLGPEVAAFESEFAAAHGVEHGVAMNSGTSALHLALLAAGVGPGDEVITVSMTFTATAAAVSYTGATPVFVDVDPQSFTMDPAQIEARITPRTKAIMPVHLYGQAADMRPILEVAARHGLKVIEDAAQAHLAEYEGSPVGGLGHIACFSFYPGKNLGAYGEGGLAMTNDAELAQKMRLLRDWGQQKKYHHEMLAYNYRMDAIQGAILRIKLRHLEAWTEARRRLASVYQSELEGCGIRVATERPERRHVYHIFSVFHPDRDGLQEYLQAQEIQAALHYPIPVHLQKAYAPLGHKEGDFPVTERTAREQLSLPMYPELQEDDVRRTCEAVRAWLKGR
jgi:dTDP-4-amino-4,6-dideoxygalactose transaminase